MCLTSKDEEKLRIQKRKILRRIIGPKKEDNEYWAFMNYKIRNLMGEEDIIRYMKLQTLRCFGHVRMTEPNEIIRKNTTLETYIRQTKRKTEVQMAGPSY